jgi:hypothetical protein
MHPTRVRRFGAPFALVLVAASGPAVAGTVPPRVDFERHVMGLLGRAGCNSASCHGSFQGRGGFRLSLFGYDSAKDYLALTHDLQGRRVNRTDPDNSLLLLKPGGQVPHGGQKRFDRNSWAYRLLREWIAQGARWQKGSGEVKVLTATPAEYAFGRPGQSGQLSVTATFADGSSEDVTHLCEFRSGDDAVAEVTADGAVRALRPGDAPLIVSYRGHVRAVRALVPAEVPSGFRYPDPPAVNYIDQAVFAKLRRLNMVPAELCTDAEFLRRVTLDTTGSLPMPAEVRAFLADDRPDKRARKIDDLLAHPLHAALWATRFCDITGNNTDTLENPPQYRSRLSQMWYEWFRRRLAQNVPYDEIVRGVLCATTRPGKGPDDYLQDLAEIENAADHWDFEPYARQPYLDLFWRRQPPVPIDQWGQKTAAAFLGVRLECAECHKHPTDRWTQADYRSFANVFGSVIIGISPQAQKSFQLANAQRNKENQEKLKPKPPPKKGVPVKPAPPPKPGPPPRPLVREVYLLLSAKGKGVRALLDPDTNRPLPPRALGGPVIDVAPGEDPRAALFEWMKAPDNPFFARSFANRVWAHYFGVGIVQPADDFSQANPPSNERLLDALARDFAGHGYDIRRLERAVLNSRTYQLSHVPNDTNRFDRVNFARAYIRPLMAEVVVDMLNDALGVQENFGPDYPKGCRAIEVGASRVQNGAVAYAFRLFGRPPRTSACDCERSLEPGLPQKLFLMADPVIQAKLQPKGNRLGKLLASGRTDDEVLDELFLATLSRPPTERERSHFATLRGGRKDRAALFADTLWALINTSEFLFNH